MEERICKACKDKFIPNSYNQIYCPDCGKNPKQAYALYVQRQKNYRDILGKTTEELLSCTCIQCGRTWRSKFHKEFCSDDCRYAYLDEHIVCEVCGRNLAELGIHFKKRLGHPVFCSNDCRKVYEWRVAREKGLVELCPQCGKEFIVKVQKTCNGYCEESRTKFCGQACYRAYRVAQAAKRQSMKSGTKVASQ